MGVLVLAAVAAIGYFNLTPGGPAEWERIKGDRAKRSAEKFNKDMQRAHYASRPISEVGVRSEAGLACPKCGGTQFQPRRTKAGRTGVVMGGLAGAALTKQKQVTCVTCGQVFKRG